ELGLVLLLAAGAGWLARALRLPAVVGYLAVGLALSPFTPGYVADRHQLEFLADLGVVLLLFEVGIEIDLARLRRDHGAITALAPIQVVVTTAVSTVALGLAGVPILGAALVGLGIAMSSSVVIVNITRSSRRTTTAATEQSLLGWSIFQDLTGVTLAVAVLALAGGQDRPVGMAALGAVAFAGVTLGAAWLLPRILHRLAGDDLLLIVSVGIGLAIAGFGALVAGIPLALAAFAAGLVIEGPEAVAVRRRLLPFRDVFAVLFFVLLGTLIDPAAVGRGLGWLALLVGLLLVGKVALVAAMASRARLEADWRQLAVGLGQAGEFSFVLASAALGLGLIGSDLFAAILGTVVGSIVVSTVLVRRVGGRPPEAPAAS
ncbi:MAG TPA: cation:proton antiporter, partial [Candidatus Limnocylindrales bacterium]